jgi:hypothetical protein
VVVPNRRLGRRLRAIEPDSHHGALVVTHPVTPV